MANFYDLSHRGKYELSLRVRMDKPKTRIVDAQLFVTKKNDFCPPLARIELLIDIPTSKLLKSICKTLNQYVGESYNFAFLVDLHSMVVKIDTDDMLLGSCYIGDKIATSTYNGSLSALLKIFAKSGNF